jgi:glycosyltransferase involved in cell wall biosynthesis
MCCARCNDIARANWSTPFGSRMRILVISDVTGYMRGGVPASMVRLISGLAERGHTVALAGDIVPAGAQPARHFPIRIPTSPELAREVGQAIDAFMPDVIHVIAMSSRGLAVLRPVLAPTRWVLTLHSLPPHERKLQALHGHDQLHYAVRALRFLPNALAWKWLLRARFIPQVIVHSEVMKHTVARYGFPSSGISLIPLGYDAAPRIAPPVVHHAGESPCIVTMGGIAHTKGQHDGLAAVALLAREHPRLRYRIVGEVRDRSYLRFLQHETGRLGLGSRVLITPNVTQEEKMQALHEADLYLQPSHEEGFCLAYIEAAAVVPRMVGADSGAIRLIGDGDPGARTVPVRSPARLCAAMRELLAADLPPDLLSRRAERLAAAFSWTRYVELHEALYRRMTSEGRAEEAPHAASQETQSKALH